jgi:hypothetical protein
MNCLEIMESFRIQVVDGDFVVQSWPSLVSLILCEVTISASDLHSLLLACSKLESFTLQSPNTFRRSTLTLTSSTLKAFQFDSSTTRLVDRITLEAGVLESLDLKDCSLEYFGQREFTQIENQGRLLFSVGHWTIHKHVGSTRCQLC